MKPFTDRLVEANRAIWAAMAGHPFVLGLAHGTLPDSALQAWVQNRSGEGFHAFVTTLGRDLDELAGAPSSALTGRLGVLFTGAAQFELAFWEMCWNGQAWPG